MKRKKGLITCLKKIVTFESGNLSKVTYNNHAVIYNPKGVIDNNDIFVSHQKMRSEDVVSDVIMVDKEFINNASGTIRMYSLHLEYLLIERSSSSMIEIIDELHQMMVSNTSFDVLESTVKELEKYPIDDSLMKLIKEELYNE